MPSLVPGRATADGTRARHARTDAVPTGHVRKLFDLSLSSIGIGTYLGSDDDETDAMYTQAIARALERGLNVIDTAISYRGQRSERVIGAVLREAFTASRLRREEIVIASKAGYVPFDGQRPNDYPSYVEEVWSRPGIVPPGELVAGVHCMAPRFLDDQIERSRRNLGLETIDVYYLHNPESGMEGMSRERFGRRVREAFGALEAAALDGRIGCYGTATWNGYRKGPGEPLHHSLIEFLRYARDVGGPDHHFRVVQLPYNLAYVEAFVAPTQEFDRRLSPLLEVAAQSGVYVMTSAPLMQGQLAGPLPEHLRAVLGLRTDAQRAVQFARSTPGVGTVLVGMKSQTHVDEVAEVARVEPLPEDAVRGLFAED